MTSNPACPITDAAEAVRGWHVGCNVAASMGVRGQAVGRVMRRRWIAVSPVASILDTLQLMRLARLRHLPVVVDGILRGVISYPVVVAAAVSGQAEQVGQVMAAESETAEASTPVAEAAVRIARNGTGCLPVVESTKAGPRLVGLVTESDLLRLAYEPERTASA